MNSPHGHLLSILASLATLIAFQSTNFAQGFLGHEISLHGTSIDENGKRRGIGLTYTALVGAGQEYAHIIESGGGSHPPINVHAFSIELDYGSVKAGTTARRGTFNGQVFEDISDTLPPFTSVTIDTEASKDISSSRVFFSPNTIWVNNEGSVRTKDSFMKLNVTFGDPSLPTTLSLTPSHTPGMIVESPTELGAMYTFEQSEDLITFTPIDEVFMADAPFKSLFVKSASTQTYYRLRKLSAPSIPLQTDFESVPVGWSAESNESETQWELGTPASDTLANAASGTTAWGTNLSSDFGPDAVAVLRSPLIDLSKHTNEAALTFRYFVDTPNVEGGQLRFVDESGNDLYTHDELFTGQSATWKPYRLVLPASLQNAKFSIEFRFLSDDDDEVGAGWFIDDVLVL